MTLALCTDLHHKANEHSAYAAVAACLDTGSASKREYMSCEVLSTGPCQDERVLPFFGRG